MIQVAVFGYGTVGSGVVEVLDTNKAEIAKKAGDVLNVKYILDLRDFPGDKHENDVVHDVNVILDDPEVKVICETMGGLEPAYTFTKRALQNGKSVCTSNKELVAAHGPELLELARQNSCSYMFEASCGGGIPIIRSMNQALTAEKIDKITGILNGTTNYILTKMFREGVDFADVLKQAQEKGYAERNPEADVEGYDACRKIAILSSLMCGKYVKYEDVYTEGITKITAEDFLYVKKMNMVVKLLATSEQKEDKLYAMVSPCLIDQDSPLYCVNEVFNAVSLHSNMLGTSMYYGRGAGKLPTASAVVGDVVDCAKNIGKTVDCEWSDEVVEVASYMELSRKFFVRAKAASEEVEQAFGKVSFVDAGLEGEVGFVTEEMTEAAFAQTAEAFGKVISRIRFA